MKKILFFVIILLTSLQINAQAKYIAFKNDMKAENDIFEIQNTPASELYLISKVWLSEIYKKPKRNIVADIDSKLLKINGKAEIPSSNGGVGNASRLVIKYTIQLEFKENKLKINIPKIEGSYPINYSNLFNPDGSRKETKDTEVFLNDIENYFNSLLNSLIHKIENDHKW